MFAFGKVVLKSGSRFFNFKAKANLSILDETSVGQTKQHADKSSQLFNASRKNSEQISEELQRKIEEVIKEPVLNEKHITARKK